MSLVNTMLEDLDRRTPLEPVGNALGFLAPAGASEPSFAWRTALLPALVLVLLAALAWQYLRTSVAAVEPAAASAILPERAPGPPPALAVSKPAPAALAPPAAGLPEPRPETRAMPRFEPVAAAEAPAEPARLASAQPQAAPVIDAAPPARPATLRSYDELQQQRREILSLLQSGQAEAALPRIEAAREKWPADPGLERIAARTLLQLGRHQQAVSLLRRLAAGGADAELLELLALAEQRVGQHERAAAAWQQLTRLDPQRGSWWFGLAVSLDARGDRPGARRGYERALSADDMTGTLRDYARQRLLALGS